MDKSSGVDIMKGTQSMIKACRPHDIALTRESVNKIFLILFEGITKEMWHSFGVRGESNNIRGSFYMNLSSF
jgi:hypothetical protein